MKLDGKSSSSSSNAQPTQASPYVSIQMYPHTHTHTSHTKHFIPLPHTLSSRTPHSSQAYGYGDPTEQYANPLPVSNDLIVLGLEWKVTTEDLRKYFEKFGEITSAEVHT